MVSIVSTAALALVAAQNTTTYTAVVTSVETITSCHSTVTDCPALNHNGTAYITHTNTITVTTCPEESPAPVSTESGTTPTEVSPETTTVESTATETVPCETSATPEAPESAPANSTVTTPAGPAGPEGNDLTTFVTVEQGVTVTVVGSKSTGVAEVEPTGSGVATANAAAAGYSIGGAFVAVAAGALLL